MKNKNNNIEDDDSVYWSDSSSNDSDYSGSDCSLTPLLSLSNNRNEVMYDSKISSVKRWSRRFRIPETAYIEMEG